MIYLCPLVSKLPKFRGHARPKAQLSSKVIEMSAPDNDQSPLLNNTYKDSFSNSIFKLRKWASRKRTIGIVLTCFTYAEWVASEYENGSAVKLIRIISRIVSIVLTFNAIDMERSENGHSKDDVIPHNGPREVVIEHIPLDNMSQDITS